MHFLGILLYLCLSFTPSGWGQEASSVDAQAAAERQPTLEEWKLTVDVIRARVDALVQENTRLQERYGQLVETAKQLHGETAARQSKNAELRRVLKERAGRTDQDVRLQELAAELEGRKDKLALRKKQVQGLRDEASGVRRALDLKRMKISEWELHQRTPADPGPSPEAEAPKDEELDALRKEIEEQKALEASLEQELKSLVQVSQEVLDRQAAASDEIKSLEDEYRQLKERKVPAQKAAEDLRRSRKEALARQTKDLESKVREYERKIDQLKGPGELGFNMQKKKMVKDIIAADTRNEQLKLKIANIEEDIGVLKEQIARLEKRINFSRGKGRPFSP